MKDEAAEFRSFAAAVPGIDELEVVIMYATNRAIDPRRTAKDVHRFADTGAADPLKVITGSAFVRAPKTEVVNRAGRLAETTGRLDRAAGRQTEETALRLRDIGMVEGDDGRQLAEAATKRLGRSARFPNQMLLYVHGYNNSFTEAMLRTAMIGYDLDFDGPLMSFSWPSRSGPTTYFGDRERAAQSAPFLVAFLERVFKHLPDVKLHVVGHSTGAEVVLAALDGLAARRAAGATSSNFGEIIFAHADVAPPRLAQSQAALAALGVRITSYSSKEDWAMSLSDWVRFKGARVGGAPVYLPQVDAIDITGLGARFALNHTVFVRNPMVFGDMARLMATGQRPPHARTPALSETRTAQGLHWEFKQR
jgi:esterase/lipase superfamily enzyme